MAKACIYCKVGLDESSVVDVCTRCGIGVWGEKMFATIIENMNDARAKGDLYQGSVTNPDSPGSKPKQANAALSSIATEAIHTQETNPFERQFNPEQKSHQQNNSFSQASNEESLGPESEASFQEKEQSASTLIGSSF